MGFKFAVNLFADRSADEVTSALREFYDREGKRSVMIYQEMCDRTEISETLEIYAFPRWTVVDIYMEPEYWIRERQLEISKQLHCAGLFLFEYDGDYWGYELFNNGEVVDRFTTNASYNWYFKGCECAGSAKRLADCFPFIEEDVFTPYLVRLPNWDEVEMDEYERLESETDHPPREGDEYNRWDEAAVLNFLRALGVQGDFTGKWGRFEFAVPAYAEIDSLDHVGA